MVHVRFFPNCTTFENFEVKETKSIHVVSILVSPCFRFLISMEKQNSENTPLPHYSLSFWASTKRVWAQHRLDLGWTLRLLFPLKDSLPVWLCCFYFSLQGLGVCFFMETEHSTKQLVCLDSWVEFRVLFFEEFLERR